MRYLLTLILFCLGPALLRAQPQLTNYTGLSWDTGPTAPGYCQAPGWFLQTPANIMYYCDAGHFHALATDVGSVAWGAITGLLSAQTDLQTALNLIVSNAANASNLTSGTLNHARLPSLVSGDIPNNAANTSGNAATATALAATPTQCSGGTPVATGIAANGNANCTTGGGGSGGINTLEVTKTSTTQLTIGAACGVSTPCNVRQGAIVYTYSVPGVVTFSGGTGRAFVYISSAGVLTVGHNVTVSNCSGCTAVGSIAGYPADSIPIWSWSITSGTVDSTNTADGDGRAFLSNMINLPGAGILETTSGNALITSVDPAILGGQSLLCADTSGSATTYTCTGTPTITSYASVGMFILIPETNGAGGAMTLNVSGLGPVALKKSNCSDNLDASTLVATNAYPFAYNGSVACLVASGSSGTGTAANLTPTATSTVLCAWNSSIIGVCEFTLTADVTLSNSGMSPGGSYTYIITDAATHKTITYPGNMPTGGAMPNQPVTPAQISETCHYDGTTVTCDSPIILNGQTGLIGPFPCGAAPSTTLVPAGKGSIFCNSSDFLMSSLTNGTSTLQTMIPKGGSIDNATGHVTDGSFITNASLPLTTGVTGVLPVANGGTAMSSASFTTQTDGATVTWAIGSVLQASAVLTFTTHGGSRTLNITNPLNGGYYTLKIKQDSTGGEGLTLGTGCTWLVSGGGAGAITPSTAASAVDVLAFTYDGTNCLANFNKNFN